MNKTTRTVLTAAIAGAVSAVVFHYVGRQLR